MKSIDEIQDEIIEEFSVFDDWMDKYALLIDLGNALPPLDEKYKTSENLSKVARAGYGCRPIIERVLFILKRRAMRLS